MIMGTDESKMNEPYKKIGAVASEALLNIRTVRACRAEGNILARYDEQVNSVTKLMLKRKPKEAFAYSFAMASLLTVFLVVFLYGPWLIENCPASVAGDGSISDCREYSENPEYKPFITPTEMFQAMMCIMWGAMGAGGSAIFMVDANKARIASADVFQIIDRE